MEESLSNIRFHRWLLRVHPTLPYRTCLMQAPRPAWCCRVPLDALDPHGLMPVPQPWMHHIHQGQASPRRLMFDAKLVDSRISKGVVDVVFLQSIGWKGTRSTRMSWPLFLTGLCHIASKKFASMEPLGALQKVLRAHPRASPATTPISLPLSLPTLIPHSHPYGIRHQSPWSNAAALFLMRL